MASTFLASPPAISNTRRFSSSGSVLTMGSVSTQRWRSCVILAVDKSSTGTGGGGGGGSNSGSGGSGKVVGGVGLPGSSSAAATSKYVVPLDKSSAASLMRPLNEILRDLNKRVPDNIIDPDTNSIPWYHANRMLSFYAPGWCGEVRDVIFSDNGSVTVVYRVTIHGTDGEAHREATGTVSSADGRIDDLVAAAEELAFCRACARFGFGLYLYHEGEVV